MQVVSNTPFRVATLLWQPSAGAFAFTVLCKATFQLRPGESVLAQEQEPLQKEDAYWGNDPRRSLSRASDLAPRKTRADVVLIGHAFAPNRAPVRSLVARLAVADVDKSIEVVCRRCYDAAGAFHEGPFAAQMPLVYERAAAGPENPAGLRPGMRDAQGMMDLPSLLPVGTLASSGDHIAPIGFGPIAATWPLRMEKLGRHQAGWDPSRWYKQPLDADMDMAYFNSAPRDQQAGSLREDERITLENLHPEHPIFVTCLPGTRPVVTVELPGKAAFPLAMRPDTLAINNDALTCAMVWRGHFPVDDPRVEGRVLIAMESGRAGARGPDALQETAAGPDPANLPEAMPFSTGTPGVVPSIAVASPDAPRPKRSGETASLPAFGGPASMPVPSAPGLPPTMSFPAVPEPSPPAVAPPPPVGTPPPPVAAPPPEPAAPPLTIGQALAAQAASASASAPADRPKIVGGVQQPELLAAVPAADDGPSRVAAAIASGGALAASNAAAAIPADPDAFGAPSPQMEASAPRPRIGGDGEVLRLAWFDLDGVPRMRRKPEFRAILDELAKRPPDREADNARIDESPAEIEDRREVMEVLLRGQPTDAEGLRAAVNSGIRDDGRFIPASLLLWGQLEMTFDAVEMLKALLPVAASFAAPNDALSTAVNGASTFVSTPGLPNPLIADTLAGRIRSAFLQTRKSNKEKLDLLDGPAAQVLVEKRLYRRRPVFGDTFVRALLLLPGSPYPVPAYFPDAAAKKLPLHTRLKVRVLAESHLAADPTESHPVALRVTALAEVLPGGRV